MRGQHCEVSIQNSVVEAVLRSPLHRLLSGSVDLVRYEGRRSGRTFVTPTQYARMGNDVVIMVGHPERKSWWRNFETAHDLDVLVRGRWLPLRGRVVRGADDPAVAARLLDAYLERFPRAERSLGSGTRADRIRAAVLVWCRPR